MKCYSFRKERYHYQFIRTNYLIAIFIRLEFRPIYYTVFYISTERVTFILVVRTGKVYETESSKLSPEHIHYFLYSLRFINTLLDIFSRNNSESMKLLTVPGAT